MIGANTIGEKIAKLRQECGFSQAELRRLTGVNIWRLEQGWFKPNIATLEKIAVALKVPITELLV